ncbi:hypothetical protein SCUP234_11244 [Seiridium cupressi]
MILREDETRGDPALESASQPELVTNCLLLNQRKKSSKYGLTTEDNLRKYHCAQEEQRKAERAKTTATAEVATAKDTTATPTESTVATDDHTITSGETTSTAEEAMVTPEESKTVTEETMTRDAAHERDRDTRTPEWERLYANPLPEHRLLSGLFFAREAEPEPCGKSLENPTEDAVVVASPLVQTAEEPAVEQAQDVSLTDSKAESKAQEGCSTDSETDSESGVKVLTGPESENEAEDETLAVPKSESEAQEGEQTKREAVKAPLGEVETKEIKAQATAYI